METVDLLSRADAGVGLAGVRTGTLARLVAGASREQLAAVAASDRASAVVLAEVFRRMAERLRPTRAAAAGGVVRWRLAGGSAGYRRFQTVIESGGCVTGTELDRPPAVTLTLSVADFLLLATGAVGLPRLLATRRLRLRGDLRFAVRLAGLFDIPSGDTEE